jgi:hypothetical protein
MTQLFDQIDQLQVWSGRVYSHAAMKVAGEQAVAAFAGRSRQSSG